MVCESLACPKISRRAGSETKKNRGNTRRFFSRYLHGNIKKRVRSNNLKLIDFYCIVPKVVIRAALGLGSAMFRRQPFLEHKTCTFIAI